MALKMIGDNDEHMEQTISDYEVLLESLKSATFDEQNLLQILAKLKSSFVLSKGQVLEVWTQHHTLQAIHQCTTPDIATAAEVLQSKRPASRKDKELMRDVLNETEQLCEQIAKACDESPYDNLKETCKRIKTKNDDVKLKKQMQCQYTEELKLLEEKLQSLREEVKQIKSQQAEDSSDSEEFVDLSKQAQQLQHTRDALIDSDAARLRMEVKMISEFAPISSYTVGSSGIIFTLQGTTNSDLLSVTAKLDARHKKKGLIVLTSAQISNSSMYIEDIVETAVDRNDVCYLLNELYIRWTTSKPLDEEINPLRERFVLDWQPGCNIMQVLFGKAADIMCELHITPGYPNSGGAVLKTVKGANTKEPIMEPCPNATLRQWLEHLQNIFEKEQLTLTNMNN